MRDVVRFTVVGALAAMVQISATALPAATLVPHRALYVMSLESAGPGSGISGVRGELGVDWSESCAGWIMEHKSFMDIFFSSRPPIRLTTIASTWESRDSRDYRFSVRNLTNGKPGETIEGRARLTGDDGSGRALFVRPRKAEKRLPPGTLFPAALTIAIVRAAAGSPTMMSSTVFDGMTLKGGLNVSTLIGKGSDAAPGDGDVMPALRGLRSWPVHMAYFEPAGRSPEPAHEIGLRLFDNGVEDRILLSFDDFKVRARLTRLQLAQPADCGG